MVTCFKCMNKLPYDCICKITEEIKVRHYFTAALRELQLCLAMLNGYKPMIKAGDQLIQASKVERKGALFNVIFPELIDVDWRKCRTFILLDKEGKPLYRYTRRKLRVNLTKGDMFIVNWELGT